MKKDTFNKNALLVKCILFGIAVSLVHVHADAPTHTVFNENFSTDMRQWEHAAGEKQAQIKNGEVRLCSSDYKNDICAVTAREADVSQAFTVECDARFARTSDQYTGWLGIIFRTQNVIDGMGYHLTFHTDGSVCLSHDATPIKTWQNAFHVGKKGIHIAVAVDNRNNMQFEIDGNRVAEDMRLPESTLKGYKMALAAHLPDARFDNITIDYNQYLPMGRIHLKGNTDLHAGEFGTWEFQYTVNPDSNMNLEKGDAVQVVFIHARDWGEPQVSDAKADNYASYTSMGSAHIELTADRQFGTWFITATIVEGALSPGETLTIIYGDASGGSRGAQAPRWAQEREELYVYERHGTPGYWSPQPIAVLPFRIVGAKPEALVVIGPSETISGESFRLLVRMEDAYGNLSPESMGECNLRCSDSQGKFPEICSFSPDSKGYAYVDVTLYTPGIHTVSCENNRLNLHDVSNPIRCLKEKPMLSTYWADIHIHSDLSDGNRTPIQLYQSARDEARLDIAAITDHATWIGAPEYDIRYLDHQINEQDWNELRQAAKEFYSPGKFVPFLAYEYSHSPQGDWNVYFFNDDAPLIVPLDASRLQKLVRSENAIVIPHVGGRRAQLTLMDSALVPVVEIVSNHGRFDDFAQESLNLGYRTGFIGSSDGHAGTPGRSVWFTKQGLGAIKARRLDKKNVLDAIKKRHTYAVSDPTDRPLLEFQIDGHEMGSEFTATAYPTINAEVSSGSSIRTIEIIRNGQIVYTHQGKTNTEFVQYVDRTVTPSVNWYYIKATNEKEHALWSSPIWVNYKQ